MLVLQYEVVLVGVLLFISYIARRCDISVTGTESELKCSAPATASRGQWVGEIRQNKEDDKSNGGELKKEKKRKEFASEASEISFNFPEHVRNIFFVAKSIKSILFLR